MNYQKLVLYHFPATRSARALWALYETLGDGFEVKTVQLYAGEQYAEDYLVKNPNHSVPLLEITLDDGSVHRMLESAAMVQWLVDAFPDKQLSPPADFSLARADYLQMMQFGGSWMDMMLWQIRIHEHVLPKDQVDERTVQRYREKFVSEVEPQLKERLLRAPYICGEQFQGADIVIGHNVNWARAYQLCQDGLFRDYLSRLSKRPAFARAFADAKQFKPQAPQDEGIEKFSG